MVSIRDPLPYLALTMLAGCATFQHAPVDLSAHHTAWAALSLASPSVGQYAARLGAPAEALTPTDGLTLAEAEVVALCLNPQLNAARAGEAITSAAAKYAGKWDDPTFGADVGRILAAVDHPWLVAGALRFTLPISGRLRAARSKAEAEHLVSLWETVGEEAALLQDLRTAWLTWSVMREQLALLELYLADVACVRGLAVQLRDAGEISFIETRVFEIEQTQRQIERDILSAKAVQAERALKGLLGLVPDATVSLVPCLALPEIAEVTDAIAQLMDNNPLLSLRRAEYEVAERNLRMEVRKQYPDLEFGPGYGEEDGEPRALLGLALPLPLYNRNAGGVAQASAERAWAQARLQTEYQRLVGAVAQAHDERRIAAMRRQRLEDELSPLMEQQIAEGLRLAELGEFDALLFLEALTHSYETKRELLQAHWEGAQADIRWRALVLPGPTLMQGRLEVRP